ncbi:MAG TPA: tetratricopeptide repeat protein [Verrucomicrobiae bacterium]|nr:tetratricopeptide repeat protein [Verrucomicrobiae bacterium]
MDSLTGMTTRPSPKIHISAAWDGTSWVSVPQAHYNLGVVLASQGQLQDAMRHFRETLTIDANYTKAHHQLAVLLNEQGNTDEAVGHLRRALQLEPEFAKAHESLGRLLVRLGKRDEAIHHFEEAVRIVRSRPAVQPLP